MTPRRPARAARGRWGDPGGVARRSPSACCPPRGRPAGRWRKRSRKRVHEEVTAGGSGPSSYGCLEDAAEPSRDGCVGGAWGGCPESMDIDFLGFGPRRETAASGGRGLAAGWPHRARRTAAGLAVLLVLSAGSSSMAQGRRVALVVVGNDAYQAQGVLRNAVNDARAVAAALGEAGLVVVTRVENAAPPGGRPRPKHEARSLRFPARGRIEPPPRGDRGSDNRGDSADALRAAVAVPLVRGGPQAEREKTGPQVVNGKEDSMDTKFGGLLPGTLDLLILKTISLDRLHGYGVLLRIRQISGEALDVPQDSLYPALYRRTGASSRPNGARARTGDAPSTTA